MTEFKKYKLGDIADIRTSNVDKKITLNQKTVKLCNFVDVYYNWAITKSNYDSFMTATASDEEISKFSLKKGQVAFTKDSETRDDIGIPAYIAEDFKDVVLGYHTALATPDENIVTGEYLNAFMHSSYIQKYFELNATGSGMRYTLSQQTLHDIPILAPDLDAQHKIGSLLSKIDRKISINREINRNLEELAKQIYDYWFVQFDFPNEEGMPYKSSGGKMVWNETLKKEIPAGWEVKNVVDVIEPIERGISYTSDDIKSNKGIPMLNLACYDKQGEYRSGEMKFFSGKCTDRVYPFEMFIACTDMTQNADIIGRPIFAPTEYNEYVYSMDLAKITPKLISKMYLYYTLRTSFYHTYIKPFASGTNVKHLNIYGIERYPLYIPSGDIQKRFEERIRPIKIRQQKCLQEIQELTELRDSLLPLLMSGQVTLNSCLSAD
ncbi:MAG: restriction endonuclease subunit S [Spirochaetia bacterium]|nr:restriction endonuclease subunit S [Spirochaetia bacterium]